MSVRYAENGLNILTLTTSKNEAHTPNLDTIYLTSDPFAENAILKPLKGY